MIQIITWAASIAIIFQSFQIATLASWLLFHYHELGTQRELRDTAAVLFVSLIQIGVRVLWAVTGAGHSAGVWFELAYAFVALGCGHYIHSSLNRRLSFYLFCAQEDRKHAAHS